MTLDIEFNHPDLLSDLNNKVKTAEKIQCIHRGVRQHREFVHRIGIAIYDVKTDTIRTFADSSDDGSPLINYEVKLSNAGSLNEIHMKGKPRVVNNLAVFDNNNKEHSSRISNAGYRSSYTVPIYHDQQLSGFVFFNSRLADAFTEDSLSYLDMIARLIALLISVDINQVQTLRGALKTATSFTGHKDPETGAHLERMARFSRLIANEIACDYGMNDEWVETVFWFAPMHDIGKIAIPDHILMKPGKFTPEEFEIMKTHTTKGREIIDDMLSHFNLNNAKFIPMLCNIAEFHHENIDGSGYPFGLKGSDIPIEARIVAVADVFDALTSVRPYKKAWSNDEAFSELLELANWKVDRRCVDILISNRRKIEEIQFLFQDNHEQSGAIYFKAH